MSSVILLLPSHSCSFLCFPGEAVPRHPDQGRTEAALIGHAHRACGERQPGVGDAGRPAAHCGHSSEPTDPLPRAHHGQTGYALLSALLLGFHGAWYWFDSALIEGFLVVSPTNCGNFSNVWISVCVHIVCVIHPAVVRISPCHSRQPSVISDASVADGDRSSTPSDINSPRHRTHSLCNVRAAWPPRPSNHTSTLFYKYLLLLCLHLFLSASLCRRPAGCQPACLVVVVFFCSVRYIQKYAYLLSCSEVDKKIDSQQLSSWKWLKICGNYGGQESSTHWKLRKKH